MNYPDNQMKPEKSLKKQVADELSEAKAFANATNIDDVRSGQWFISLLAKIAKTYDQNVRAEYFQKKYPGLPPDEVADILIGVTVKYATIAGGVAGAAVTANQIAALSTAGATVALMAGSIGAEMIYLARIQMRLVLDIAVLYDLQLNADDPEDILMVFGYAIGVVPTELAGKGLQKAAAVGTQQAIKKYVSKGTLKTIQTFGKRIGMKILQRSIIKYAVPIVSSAVGSTYNYYTTKTIGQISKAHLKNRGKVTEELRSLISRRNKYHIVFPAAVLFMAHADGKYVAKEKEFYMAVLSRLNLDEYEQEEFQKLLASQENILEAILEIEETAIRENLLKVMALMAVYDGELASEEKELLIVTANKLAITIDIEEIEKQTLEYKVIIKENIFQKSSGKVKSAATSVGESISKTYSRFFNKENDK